MHKEIVMRKLMGVVAVLCWLFLGSAAASAPAERDAAPLKPSFSGSFQLGYAGGTGAQAGVTIANFARGFPWAARLAVGYVGVDPGDPLAARANFINDNTDGTPEESGRVWDLRLDFLVPLHWMNLQRAYVVAGPRRSSFQGTFTYVGGNEKFDVTSSQWALGAGLESYFPMSERADFLVGLGLDNYFKSTLEGHDTAYSPNGETVNGRDGFDYASADKAIHQPKLEFRAMLGVAYRL
jgi:hypothetical protein